jgi:hypothetical protein
MRSFYIVTFLLESSFASDRPRSTSPEPKATPTVTPAPKVSAGTTTASPHSTTTTRGVDPEMTKPVQTDPIHFSFLHMTDLHISKSRPYSLENLRLFCDKTFPTLIAGGDVLFLALTGDFTDGMGDFLSLAQFGQQEGDWTAFRSALEGCVKVGLPIFKIRGNHDAFGVESFKHPSNLFFVTIQEELKKLTLKHAHLNIVSTHDNSGSFGVQHHISKSRYVFLDAGRITPSPHQYHGEFSDDQAKWLQAFIEGPSNSQAASTYIFIHFPLGCLTPLSRERLLKAVSKSSSRVTFLSGHIHSLIGRRGVQAVQSHDHVDELQLSDFKWSGTVRKVDVSSGFFVDIPLSAEDSATVLMDPTIQSSSQSLVGVFAHKDSVVDSVTMCGESKPLRPETTMNGMYFFSTGEGKIGCVNVTSIDSKSGKRMSNAVTAVDTRLWPGSFARLAFTYFFETLQVVILLEYIGIVLIARSLFKRFHDLPLTLYLVLCPLIPTTVSDNFYSRPWVLSNGVAGIDIETREVFLDYETIRLGAMMLCYLLFATAVHWKVGRNQSSIGKWIWTAFLFLFTLADMRMMIARGGLKTCFLSPHSWFIGYMWYLWTTNNPPLANMKSV